MKLIKLLLDKKLIKESEVGKDYSFSDMKTRCLSNEEIVDYLNKIFEFSNLTDKEKSKFYANSAKNKKRGENELLTVRNSVRDTTMPYIHPNVVKNAMDKDNLFLPFMSKDEKMIKLLQNFYRDITQEPDNLFGQNEKIEKSSNEATLTLNVGIPSINGIIARKPKSSTPVFEVLDTCPGAGTCKAHCYTLQGNYIKFDSAFYKQTRILNFLINQPEAFIDKAIDEILYKINEVKKDIYLQLRWNDAGDIFSKDYLKAIKDITNKLNEILGNDTVKSYLYTKSADIVKPKLIDSLHVMYSINNAKPSQTVKIQEYVKNGDTVRLSFTVPKSVVDGFFDFKNKQFIDNLPSDYMVQIDNNIQKFLGSLNKFGNFYLDEYNKAKGGLKLIKELKKIPDSSEPIYNVLVLPGDSDIAAQRKDVKNLFLVFH